MPNGFDPDKFIKSRTDFDPDEFIQQRQEPEVFDPTSFIQQRTPQAKPEPFEFGRPLFLPKAKTLNRLVEAAKLGGKRSLLIGQLPQLLGGRPGLEPEESFRPETFTESAAALGAELLLDIPALL